MAALYLWIDTGSAEEVAGQEGIAHLLEHMLFKGTATRGIGQCAAEIEGMGGDLNAYTSHEQTVLHATVAAEQWRAALDVLVDMARRPAFDPEELEREKRVVIEEIRGSDDEPDTVLSDAMAAAMFPGHPYGRPILGTAASVAAIDAPTLRAFWSTGWCGSRAILAVAGDVDADAVEAAVRETLGDWQAGTPRTPRAPIPREPHPPLRVGGDFETTLVELAWHGPALDHPDVPALDVAMTAIGQGAASLFTTRLQLEESIASDAWSSLWARPAGGVLSAGFLPRSGATAQAVELALSEMREVSRRGLSGVSVDRSRTAVLADFLFADETVDGQAHELAWYAARHGDPEARRAYRDRVAAVTPGDVARVCRTWLDPDRCTVGVVDAALSSKALARAVKKARDRRRPDAPRGPQRHEVNGIRVWILPDDSPVAAVRFLAFGGALAEGSRTAGTSLAWSRMVTAGAADLDAAGWGEACDDLAGAVEAVAGRNTVGLAGTFPATAIEDGIALMGQALIAPHFDAEEWARIHEELRDDVKTLSDRPYEVASQRMWRALWSGHPWALPLSGTLSTLARITPRRLRRWHHGLFTRDNLVVAVAGGVDPHGVIEALEEWTAEIPEGAAPGLPARPSPPERFATQTQARAGNEQANLVMGARGLRITDPDRRVLDIAAGILGAQGGRLFLELREARGLAYSVWAWSHEGLDGGVFSAGLATDPRRVPEARAALADALERLATTPPSDEEVVRTRNMLVGQAAMGLQRASGRAFLAAAGERYGLPFGLDAYREELAAVDGDAVTATLRRVLDGGTVEVVVTPRD